MLEFGESNVEFDGHFPFLVSLQDGTDNELRIVLAFEKSKLLNYLETATDVQQFSDGEYYPDKWPHYGVLTGNHVIDIISSESPIIRRIE